MMKIIMALLLQFTCSVGFAQSDIEVGTAHQLNLQRKNVHADAFILHNAVYSSGDDNLKWKTVDTNFGSRGIRFSYGSGRGIYFYADETNPVSTTTEFTPTTRFFIGNNGKIGMGTTTLSQQLHVGNSAARGLSIQIGERASIGLSYTNAETVVGNNAVVDHATPNILAIKTATGASAITMKWNNGIHFYVTNANVTEGQVINTAAFEKMRITPNDGVFADQITVEAQSAWPDYVFDRGYQLPELKSVKSFIETNKHLPGVPSANEIAEKGINLGQMNAILLEKIEQLMLYAIEQDKKLADLVAENEKLKARLTKLESTTSQK